MVISKRDLPLLVTSALSTSPNSLDIILSFFMIYHLENPENALKNWLIKIKVGGKIVITAGTEKNKSKMKKIKSAAAKEFSKNIHRLTEACDFNKVLSIVSKLTNIKIIHNKVYKSKLYIKDSKIIMDSVNSTKDTFKPESKNKEWKMIHEYIKNKVDIEIKKKGNFVDNVDRGVIILERV